MKKQFAMAVASVTLCMLAAAQSNAPSPGVVGGTIAGYWSSNRLTDAQNYITNLYTACSNYVPAILAQAIYELDWKSNPSNFLSGVNRVYGAGVGNDSFRASLSARKHEVEQLLQAYYQEGTSHNTLTTNQNVQAIWAESTNWPYLDMITNAPATTLSSP